jgi:hypothetical protein
MTAWQSSETRTGSSASAECPCSGRDMGTSAQSAVRHEIAGLSDQKIESLTNAELCELIRLSEHPWSEAKMESHLSYADRCTLLRLAYLARRCCRNAESALQQQQEIDELDDSMYRRGAGTLFGDPR